MGPALKAFFTVLRQHLGLATALKALSFTSLRQHWKFAATLEAFFTAGRQLRGPAAAQEGVVVAPTFVTAALRQHWGLCGITGGFTALPQHWELCDCTADFLLSSQLCGSTWTFALALEVPFYSFGPTLGALRQP